MTTILLIGTLGFLSLLSVVLRLMCAAMKRDPFASANEQRINNVSGGHHV